MCVVSVSSPRGVGGWRPEREHSACGLSWREENHCSASGLTSPLSDVRTEDLGSRVCAQSALCLCASTEPASVCLGARVGPLLICEAEAYISLCKEMG